MLSRASFENKLFLVRSTQQLYINVIVSRRVVSSEWNLVFDAVFVCTSHASV